VTTRCRHHRRPLLLAALLLLAATGRAEVIEVAWRADGSFVHQATVAGGKVIELCAKLPAGQRVRWSFESNAPAEFNIHYHEGREVVYAVQPTPVSSGRDTLLAASAQDYCWMWRNNGTAPLALKAALKR
jgi:hypothetical protein